MTNALQSFDNMVSAMCASLQDSYGSLIDVTSGSVARALLESSASMALWIQYLNVQVLASNRLATSSGTDVDSWVGDFGLSRLAAQAAGGQVVMTSLNPAGQSATVPNGATVRSADGSVTFAVTGGPYTRPAGTASVAVSVLATVAGTIGNVAAGDISLLGSSIPGIDTVTNPLAFANGADAETDAALRTRFVSFINSRALATPLAITTAVESLQLGMSCVVLENTAPDGSVSAGHFTVVVDDGSGDPSSVILAAASTAIEAVRPVGSTFSILAPIVIEANVAVSVGVDAQASVSDVSAAICSAITNYIEALGVGDVLHLSRIVSLAYGASNLVINVGTVTLNGSGLDLGGAASAVVRAGAITVTGGA